MQRLEEILEKIAGGESLTVEFKQQFTEYDKIAKEMIAFANTKGGSLIFGVRDNRKILGIPSEKEIAELVKETAEKYCVPKIFFEINFYEYKNKLIAVVEIPESQNKPHRIEDYKLSLDLNTAQVYVRVNDKSVLAGKEMIKIMQLRANKSSLKNYSVGKNEKIALEYLDENDFITAKILSKIANISNRRASRTLINLVRADILLIHTKDTGEAYFTYAGDI
jgi:predicted HTH transcriptional regulator